MKENTTENKFLMITHAFPPFGGGGVQRMTKFAKYLQNDNWIATVVFPNEKNDSWLDYKRTNEVNNIQQLRIGLRNLKTDPLIKKAIRKLYPIDVYFSWAIKVFKRLKQEDLGSYKVVFTSGPPHSVHVVGYLLSKYYGIKWVADFRDHFTLGPGYKAGGIKKIINSWFESLIYNKAAAIVLNTNTNKQEVLESISSAAAEKIFVIYNGFDYDDLKTNEVKVPWNTADKLHYLYLGGLRGDQIDGTFYHILFRAIKHSPNLRNEIQIHIVGDYSRKGNLIEILGIGDVFDFLDPVAFNSVGDYLSAADGCLTWQTAERRYKGTIAGKVFDYIGLKRPIFSLGQQDGEIANILHSNKIGISADPADLDRAALAFLEYHQKVKSGYFSYSALSNEFFIQYDRVQQSKALAKLFNSVIKS